MTMTRPIRIFLLGALCIAAQVAAAELPQSIALPAPRKDGGKPLMQALNLRQSAREFGTQKLEPQVLSNLLWAAFGVNRADTAKRTAPSASNRLELDIYVAMPEGLFLYDAKAHRLEPVLGEDIRAATGTQDFVAKAAINLVYVSDFAKMGNASDENRILYSAADVGFVSQNVYLFCASEGLATVVRGSVDKSALAKIMRLRPEQKIILAQSVGYPPK
jgi:SagB-type dehydrogenase family enzyme